VHDSQASGDDPRNPDASDVVTGPVGSATLRDPEDAADHAADLGRLPAPDEMDQAPDGDKRQPG
jgi:hypothetical protein